MTIGWSRRACAAGKGEEWVLHLRMGEQLKTEEERPLQKDRIARFDLFSDQARKRDLLAAGQEGQMPGGKKLRPGTGVALAVMDRMPRPITMERDKFNKYLEDEGQEAVIALRARLGQSDQGGKEVYSRYLKALIQDRDVAGSIPSTLYKRRVGQRLEILLENDPGRMKADKMLTVKVLFEGKPLAGAKVFACRREAGGAEVDCDAGDDFGAGVGGVQAGPDRGVAGAAGAFPGACRAEAGIDRAVGKFLGVVQLHGAGSAGGARRQRCRRRMGERGVFAWIVGRRHMFLASES